MGSLDHAHEMYRKNLAAIITRQLIFQQQQNQTKTKRQHTELLVVRRAHDVTAPSRAVHSGIRREQIAYRLTSSPQGATLFPRTGVGGAYNPALPQASTASPQSAVSGTHNQVPQHQPTATATEYLSMVKDYKHGQQSHESETGWQDLWKTESWTLQQIRIKWQTRPESVRNVTSAKWQESQQKFVFLLAFGQVDREAIFAEMADLLAWSYKTMEKYWSAFIKGAQSIEATITIAMRAQQRVFHFMAQEEDPKNPTVPGTPAEIETACTHLVPAIACAVRLAYILGQRMGDVLNLWSSCAEKIFDPVSQTWFLALLFRKTKTTRTAQPYTLHVPLEGLGHTLWELSQQRQQAAEHFLFLDKGAAKDEQAKVQKLSAIKDAMRKASPLLSVLSIRRGGLQAMALAGMSTETLLAHSRHQRIENLHRYLDWGKVFMAPARELFALSATTIRAFQLVRPAPASTALQAQTIEDFERLEIEAGPENSTSGQEKRQ